jgi:alanyl-tRNA synthetase
MGATERLYYTDSHLVEFQARVTHVTDRVSGWTAVALDRTAFYPTGGGQPSDAGTLNDALVVECLDEDGGGVLHLVQGRAPAVGAEVTGRIDWRRRLDHIQQHTGQHILSQAFIKLFNAETRGFRIMQQASEIDVALENPSDDGIEQAIDLANQIIWEDRPVLVKQVSAEEAEDLTLRKESTRKGEMRLIEIEGFDLTPCGGTHAYRTGEVGMLAVRSWERAKGLARIEFVAGGRALADYRRANRTARSVAALFSAVRDEAPALVAHLFEENKQLLRRTRTLEEIAARVEAEELLGQVEARDDSFRLVIKTFDDRDADSLKRLAQQVIAHPGAVALLGSQEAGKTVRLVFARSPDAPGDMNALMKDACAIIEGRGGGRPDMAQGGGPRVDKLAEALDQASTQLVASLEKENI